VVLNFFKVKTRENNNKYLTEHNTILQHISDSNLILSVDIAHQGSIENRNHYGKHCCQLVEALIIVVAFVNISNIFFDSVDIKIG